MAVASLAPDIAAQQAERILSMLDIACLLPGYKSISIFASDYEPGIAEHSLKLWASTYSLPIEDKTLECDGRSIRSLTMNFDARSLTQGCVCVQWPGVSVVERDSSPWRPSDAEVQR